MPSTAELKSHFDRALPYDPYVASGTPSQQPGWANFHIKVQLTDAQRGVLSAFSRRINVLVLSGTWCGDCVQQVPMFDHIARASRNAIALRIADRDEHNDLSEAFTICGGRRVPTVLFLNEDFEFMGLAGDSTLSRLRAKAARSLGAACPLPGADVPADEIAANLQDWVNEFERVHLLARLSPKLRQRHDD
jgi:thioredoxin-like negative regulator of GroEL